MTSAPIWTTVSLALPPGAIRGLRYPWDRLRVIGDVLVLTGPALHEQCAALSLKKMARKRGWSVSYKMEANPDRAKSRMIITRHS